MPAPNSVGSAMSANQSAVHGDRVGKCPQCGAGVPSLTYVCAYCGVTLGPRPNGNAGSNEAKMAPGDALTQAGRFIENVIGTNIRDEARHLPDSPEELITFFSKHIGGVSFNRNNHHHLHACEGALTKLWAFSANDPTLARVVAELQVKLEAAKSSQKRVTIGVLVATVLTFVLIFCFIVYMAKNQTNSHEHARDEVQKLIGQGRYNEARIRAHGLEFKQDIDQMLQTIDKAENSSKQRSR